MADSNVFQQPQGGNLFPQSGGGGSRPIDYMLARQFGPQQTLYNQSREQQRPAPAQSTSQDVTASGKKEYEQLISRHFKFSDVASPIGSGDPVTGQANMSSESSGRIAGFIGRHMASPVGIESTPAASAGPMFQEMARRGMVPSDLGRMSDSDRMRTVGQKLGLDSQQVASFRESDPEQFEQIAGGLDSGKAKAALQGMSGSVKAMKEMFSSSGQGDASMSQIFDSLEQITQGGMNRMKPERIQGLIREMNTLSKESLTGVKDIMSASSDAGKLADSLSLDRGAIPQTQLGNIAFTGAAQKRREGLSAEGQRPIDELAQLDQGLRISGAASPSANQMNATMGLRDTTGFTEGSAAESMSDAIEQGQAKFKDPSSGQSRSVDMAPNEWMKTMQQGGVAESTAEESLSQHMDNQEYGQLYDTSRVVRQVQAESDIVPALGIHAEKDLTREFERHGLAEGEAKKAAKFAGQQLASATLGMDIEDRTDPAKRSELMGDQMKRVVVDGLKARGVDVDKSRLSGDRQKVLGAQVFDAMDAGIEESPNLRKFGNMSTVMDLFDQKTLQESESSRSRAESIRRLQDSLDDPGAESPLDRMRGVAIEGYEDPGATFGDVESRTYEHQPKDELLRRMQPTKTELDEEIRTGRPDGGRGRATLSDEQKQGRQDAYDFIGALMRESTEGPKQRLEIPRDKAHKEEDRRDDENKEQGKKAMEEKLSHDRLTTPVYDLRGGGDDMDRANLVRQPRQEVAQAVSATEKQGSKRAGDRDAVTINGTLAIRNGQGVILDGKATGLGSTQDENESERVSPSPSRVSRPMALG